MSASGTDMGAPERPPVDPEAFRITMRQLALPVAIIAAQHGTTRDGLTTTTVCSAAADPPMLVVCVNRNASVEALVGRSRTFSVNFLSEEQSPLARLFSGPHRDPETRFAADAWRQGATGSPVLEAAVGSFECEVVQKLAHGTHNILLGRVVAIGTHEGSPLLYRDGFFRRLATA
jgi:flavin reductase (NADH)